MKPFSLFFSFEIDLNDYIKTYVYIINILDWKRLSPPTKMFR